MKLFMIPSKDETIVKPYIVRTIFWGIIVILFMVLALYDVFMYVPYAFMIIFKLILRFSLWQIFFGIISICIVFSQKKELDGKYNVEISKDDLLFWIINAVEPDEVLIIFNGCKLRIDIRFDYTGNGFRNRGKFVDKGIYIDKKEYSIDSCINYLSQKIDTNLLYIAWYTENNNPELFVKMINKMKKDKIK